MWFGKRGVGGEGEGTRHPTPKCDNPPTQIGCDDATRPGRIYFVLPSGQAVARRQKETALGRLVQERLGPAQGFGGIILTP
jgi:hypothetical protein